MKDQRFLILAGALALAALLVSGVVLAQGVTGPQSPQDVTAALGTGFTYQGQLKQGGSPVTDNCEMAFRLYDDASAGAQVGSAITRTVVISDGLFTENLDFASGVFTGDARWLGIRVKCTGDSDYADLGRQELAAVPYALYALSVAAHDHWGETWSGTGTGLALSGGSMGLAAEGSDYAVRGRSDSGYGVYGRSDSGYGVYAMGAGGDLQLYDGTIYANRLSSSDLELHSNDNVDVHLDDDSSSTSQFRVLSDADTAVFTVDESGSITSTADTEIAVSPLNLVAFYDSNVDLRPTGIGWIEVRPNGTGAQPVYVPVDLPSVLFGTATRLKSIRICYKCDTSLSYIERTYVRYATDSGSYQDLISDLADRQSESWECYTLTDTTPDEIQGSLWIHLGLDFADTGSSHDIQIGKITLTLTE